MSNNKVAIVTGAGSGVGRASAIALNADGYCVALAGRRIEQLDQTRDQCPDSSKVLTVTTDVSQPEQVQALFDKTVATYGRLDVLFNNAGSNTPATPIEDLAYEDWCRVVNVNLTGAFLCAQAAVRIMKDQTPKGGRIINNGSISAHAPRPFSLAYTSTKHAITGLTKCLSLDGRVHDIACGQIDIGNAVTPMTERMTKGVPQADGSIREEPRMAVEHVASSVVHMASLPLDANVQFMTVMASKMPFVGRG